MYIFKKYFRLKNCIFQIKVLNYGVGGWGVGDWGLGIGPNPQSPIPNPQSPIPNPNPHKIFL